MVLFIAIFGPVEESNDPSPNRSLFKKIGRGQPVTDLKELPQQMILVNDHSFMCIGAVFKFRSSLLDFYMYGSRSGFTIYNINFLDLT